jgi:hypothetical protein
MSKQQRPGICGHSGSFDFWINEETVGFISSYSTLFGERPNVAAPYQESAETIRQTAAKANGIAHRLPLPAN